MRTALGVVLASVVLAFPATADSARLVRVASNFDSPVHVAPFSNGSLSFGYGFSTVIFVDLPR